MIRVPFPRSVNFSLHGKQPIPQPDLRVRGAPTAVSDAGKFRVTRLGLDVGRLERRDHVTRTGDGNGLVVGSVKGPNRDVVHLLRIRGRPDSTNRNGRGE